MAVFLLGRRRDGGRRTQYPARCLCAKAENIEHADAVSAAGCDASKRGDQ